MIAYKHLPPRYAYPSDAMPDCSFGDLPTEEELISTVEEASRRLERAAKARWDDRRLDDPREDTPEEIVRQRREEEPQEAPSTEDEAGDQTQNQSQNQSQEPCSLGDPLGLF